MKPSAHSSRRAQGAILLEVVLALVLFVGAAAVIGAALHASNSALDQTRLRLHALDLAASTLAELQMGSLDLAEAQAQPFPAPFEDWTREIFLLPGKAAAQNKPPLQRVEVVVRHANGTIVHRLSQWMPAPPKEGEAASAHGDTAALLQP